MEPSNDIPSYLQLDKTYGHLSAFRLTKIWKTVEGFANDFAIEMDVALLATLAGLAHSMGSMVRTSTTFGSIEPPFSLLLVTPEAEPVWTEIPVRFLTHEFDAAMRQSLEAYMIQKKMEGCKKGEDPSDTSLKNAAELANRLYVDGMVERITTNSVLFPFPRSLIDNHVLITTPPVGVRRALRQLKSLQKFQLENALSTGTRLVAPDGVRSSGVPSFYWQLPEKDLAPLCKENPWFAMMPFVVLQTSKPGRAVLDPLKSSASDLLFLCRELVQKRNNAMGQARTFKTDGKTFQPYRSFLEKAQTYAMAEETPGLLSPLKIAELGMKFSMILTVMDQKREPDSLEVNLGLELAKRAAIQRIRIFNSRTEKDVSNDINLDGLSKRERAVFLRIAERNGISKTELGRSFSRMRKDERDEILFKLVSRKLISLNAGKLLITHI